MTGTIPLRNRARLWVGGRGSHRMAGGGRVLAVPGFSLRMKMPYEITELLLGVGEGRKCVELHSLLEQRNVHKAHHRAVSSHLETGAVQKLGPVLQVSRSWAEGSCLCL